MSVVPAGDGELRRSMDAGMDLPRMEKAVRELLEAMGEDPERDGLRDTPARVARMYAEVASGIHDDPARHLTVTFDASHDEMVMVRDIPLYSLCVPSKQTVNALDGAKRATDVAVGDKLWTFDDAGRLTTTEVVSVGWRHTGELVEIRAGSHRIRLTPNHPVMTPGGWVDAGALVAGDKLQAFPPRQLHQKRHVIREGYELGYVIGAVSADASVQDGRRISLCVRDKAIADRFAHCLRTSLGVEARQHEITVPRGSLQRDVPMHRVRVVSRQVGELVLHWFGGTKATKAVHLPRVVLRSEDMLAGFLQGYCDADGCWNTTADDGSRTLSSPHPEFLEELGQVLGTKPWIDPRGVGTLQVPAHWIHPDACVARELEPVEVPLLPPDEQWVEVDSVEVVRRAGTRPFRVYSFHCEPYHSFLVGGVGVKNCEHHLAPFIGKAHVAYIPGRDGRITGLSKIARLVDGFSRRPQVQEKLTTQIADAMEHTLDPRGVVVVIEAEHLCMSMRGIQKSGSTTVTSAVRGLFRENIATREEAMRFITGRP